MKRYALMLIAIACYLNAVPVDDYLSWSVKVEEPKHRDPSYYFILAAGETTASELVSQIYDGLDDKGGSRAFIALANLLGGDSSQLPFSEVAGIVHAVENQASVDSSKLRLSYQIAAFYNTRASFDFLKERTKKSFWQQSGMPTFALEAPDAPGRAEKIRTAQTMAISAVAQHPSQEAERYLKALLSDPEYSQDELLSSWIKNSLESRSAYHLAAFEQRQEAQRIKDARGQSSVTIDGSVADIPVTSSASEVEEAAEETQQPKPATEEPAEVATSEPSEEPAEQSSQWWLWLIGALVVVGGILVLRPKK